MLVILLLTYNFHHILESIDFNGFKLVDMYQEVVDSKYLKDI